ncbi:MAG: ATP-binding protein [Brevundimonas sp.]|uniref:ATP-binding protein n=1 Tax=Brevundimonas sp. TaxID=1871086 RepID=UPI002487CDF0|nr:ATP-binding protein [Brevundimonas sp.]MDI1327685.1 ATP-binding protein [Brevundimonas sp.]
MTSDQTRHIAQTMANRAGQWRLRVGSGAAAALVFFPLTGATFALAWIVAYSSLQIFEARFRPAGALAKRLGEEGYSKACIALVFANNLLFGLLGAVEMLSGSALGLICGVLLLGGAIITAVMVSPGSKQLMLAALTPQLFYAALVPAAALRQGLSPVEAGQIVMATALLILAGMLAWGRLTRTFQAMEDAQLQAEQANQAKSSFLATMSHEIRTPLNGVLGMAQIMAADELSDRQRERLGMVTHSGQALLTILSDVLDLAKIEAGKVELELVVFDLNALVERSQAIFRAIAESKGLEFTATVEATAAGSYRGDATRLHQILCNLLSNAVKFTEQGGVAVTVAREAGDLMIQVRDTGPGVTPEQLPRLFEKFVQADASTTRRYGGTGLGLSICGELARIMGGTIQAEHVRPHGLAFCLRLPIEQVGAHEIAAEAPTAPIGQAQDREIRLLAAEDHPVNRQVLAMLLSQAGIAPHIVENGALAVEAWRDGDWDLILMDVQMPVMDGPTAARAIRAEEAARGRRPVPIIALTANVMTHQIEEYRQAGMTPVVAKPIVLEELLGAIEAALESIEDDEEAARINRTA